MQEIDKISNNTNFSGLKKRAFLFLETGDFTSAREYFDKVLDQDPEDSDCYWGMLLADLNCNSEEGLENVSTPISQMQNFIMANRFGDDEQKQKYQRYSELIDIRYQEETKRKEKEEQERKEKERIELEEANRLRNIKIAKRNKRLKYVLIILAVIAVCAAIGTIIGYDIKRTNEEKKAEKIEKRNEFQKENAKGFLESMYDKPYIIEDGDTKWLMLNQKIVEYPAGEVVYILTEADSTHIRDTDGTWHQGYDAVYTGGRIVYNEKGYPISVESHSHIPYPDRKTYFVVNGGMPGGYLSIKWKAWGEEETLRPFAESDIVPKTENQFEEVPENKDVIVGEPVVVDEPDPDEITIEDFNCIFDTVINGKKATWRYQGHDTCFGYLVYDAQDTGTTDNGPELELYMVEEGKVEDNCFFGKGYHYTNGYNDKDLYVDFEMEIRKKDGLYHISSDAADLDGAEFEMNLRK